MKKRIIVSSIGIVLIVVGIAWYVWAQGPSQEGSDISVQEPASNHMAVSESEEQVQAVASSEKYDELSLQAFAQKEFVGRNLELGQVKTRTDQYTQYFITYESGELTISGIMNVPNGEGPFPVLILNHGYIDPAIYTNGRGLRREQDYLARRGYVVIHPDYRNHAQSDKVDGVDERFRLGYAEDVINAINAVKNSDLPYFDKERIGMMGHSLGGGVAEVIMVTKPDLVDAFMLYAPVSVDARDNYERWISRRPEVAERILTEYGSPEENPTFWDNISPISFLDQVTSPIAIHHGTADESVPLAWSERLARELEAANKDVELYTYPGEPHEFAAAWGTVMQRTVDFFDQHVKQ